LLTTTLTLDPSQGKQRARLYRLGVVTEESTAENGATLIRLQMPRSDLLRLIAEEHLDPAAFDPTPLADVPVGNENPGLPQVDGAA
jgi:GTPase